MNKAIFRATTDWSGEGVRCVARMQQHKITVDEPAQLGGGDAGPNPIELILAALGSCMVVVVTMLAPRFGVELKSLRVRTEGDIDTDGFMGKSDVRTGFQQVRYKVDIDTPASDDQVMELLAHAERLCPVKDTLSGVEVVRA